MVGRPTLGQCGLDPRGGRLLHQNLASVRHVGGHTGPQGLHIHGLRGGLGRHLRHLRRLGGGLGGGGGALTPMGGGASSSTTTTSGPRFVCFPGLPPLGAYCRIHSAVGSTTEGGGSYPPTWWMPPPLCNSATLPSPYTPPPTKNTPSKGNKNSFGGGRSSQTNTKKPQPFPPLRHSATWPFPPKPTHRREG